MSTETPNPQPGDRVRVTPKPYEGELMCDGSLGRLIQVRDDEGRLNAFGPAYATVELLGRALCSEIEGATGIRCQQPTGHVGGHKGTSTDAQTAAVGYPLFVSWPAETEPPARKAVRVPNEPHGLTEHLRQVIRERVAVGDKWGAVDTLVHCTLMDREQAASYVEDMAEYQAYLSEHGEETRTLHVHPHVWKSLGAWLHSMHIRLVPQPGGEDRVYGMEPVDGGWS